MGDQGSTELVVTVRASSPVPETTAAGFPVAYQPREPDGSDRKPEPTVASPPKRGLKREDRRRSTVRIRSGPQGRVPCGGGDGVVAEPQPDAFDTGALASAARDEEEIEIEVDVLDDRLEIIDKLVSMVASTGVRRLTIIAP